MKIHFLTTTYNRKDGLKSLLDSIDKVNNYDVQMTLVDDCSDYDVSLLIKGYLFPIKLIKHEYNYGKKLYWKTLTELYDTVKDSDADYFITIPDDMYLLSNTIDEAIYYWERIDDLNKMALTIYPQRFQKIKNKVDCYFGDNVVVIKCNFIDHIFLATKDYFKHVNYNCPEVPGGRWKKKSKSSGTSMVLGKLFMDYGLYMTPRSLVADHKSQFTSKMND